MGYARTYLRPRKQPAGDNVLLFIYLFIFGYTGLHCCMQAFSSGREQGLLFVAVLRLLIAVASLVAEHRL